MSRRGLGPILLGVCIYVFLLVGWQTAVAPLLPEKPLRVGARAENPVWFEPDIGPFSIEGEEFNAELLFVGDSRIHCATLREVYNDHGLGPSGILWGPTALVDDLISAAEQLKPKRMVLAFSATSMRIRGTDMFWVLYGSQLPRWDEDNFEWKMYEWRTDAIARMIAAGYRPVEFRALVEKVEKAVRASRSFYSWTPSGIDQRLSRWAGDSRQRIFYTLETGSWASHWFKPLKPHLSDENYTGWLKSMSADDLKVTLRSVTVKLHNLSKSGIEVACVRLPLDAGLRKIENTYIPPDTYRRICKRAGVPFFDHSRDPATTSDGTHLTANSAREFTNAFVKELQEELGW